jgi:adenylate kinase family enzyme
VLDARFRAGRDIRRLVEDRAWFVDQILQEAWKRFTWSEDADIALLAVGGYGRGELHPYSDIDLLILLCSNDHEIFREPIEGFLTLLWDIGLEVGQSVRSVDECAEEARAAGQPVRKDDTPEVFAVRLQEYYKNTAPLIGYYWAKKSLVQIDGMAAMDQVATAIAKVLDKA